MMKKNIGLFLTLLLLFSLVPCISTNAWADNSVVITLGSAEGKPGDTVTIPLSIANNSGFCTFEFVISYDSAKLTPLEVANTNEVWPGGYTVNLAYKPDSLMITGVSATNRNNSGAIANIRFKIKDNAAGGETGITFNTRDFLRLDENMVQRDIAYTANNGRVTIDAPANPPAAGGGGGGAAAVNAQLSPTAATYNTSGGQDLTVTLTLNGNTLRGLKVGAATLKAGADYSVSGSAVAIKAAYLATLGLGEHKVVFEMSAGANPLLTITVTDSATEQEAAKPVYQPLPPLHSAGTRVEAAKTNNLLLLDGQETAFPAVKINGNNWLKLRDFAMLVSGSSKQFSVDYTAASGIIDIRTKEGYQPLGNELTDKLAEMESAIASPQSIRVDGGFIQVAAYNIQGYNYFRLRDLAIILNFSVIYNEETTKITLDFTNPYTE